MTDCRRGVVSFVTITENLTVLIISDPVDGGNNDGEAYLFVSSYR